MCMERKSLPARPLILLVFGEVSQYPSTSNLAAEIPAWTLNNDLFISLLLGGLEKSLLAESSKFERGTLYAVLQLFRRFIEEMPHYTKEDYFIVVHLRCLDLFKTDDPQPYCTQIVRRQVAQKE